MTQDDATHRQIEAADPTRSTWLSANAGSGKTRVLTDRVARLLLDGTKPENVLCLTYTKAAASEMQNRLFKRLGEWAMMPANELRDQLVDMGATAIVDGAYLANARKLFAAAIETPGGLKIQTIHSFCAGILRRFPLEAEVSPQFKEMEDRAAAMLRQDVLDDMATSQADIVAQFAKYYTSADITQFLAAITGRRAAFLTKKSDDDLARAFGVPAGTTRIDAIDVAFVGGEDGLADDLADACKGTSKTYETFAADLKALNLKSSDMDRLKAFLICSCTRPIRPASHATGPSPVTPKPSKPSRISSTTYTLGWTEPQTPMTTFVASMPLKKPARCLRSPHPL